MDVIGGLIVGSGGSGPASGVRGTRRAALHSF